MRVRRLWMVACLLLMLGVASYGDDPPMVALVSSLSGAAKVNHTAAALLSPLASGDVVELQPGASAVLSFVDGGTRVTLHGPCRASVNRKGVTMLAGRDAHIDRPKLEKGGSLAMTINVNRMGGVTQRAVPDEYDVTFVGDRITMLTTPHFAWHIKAGFAPRTMHVRIKQVDAYDEKWQVPAGADGFTVPPDHALAAGGTYQVSLWFEDENQDHHQGKSTYLQVLSADELRQLQAQAASTQAALKQHPEDTTPLVQLINRYRDEHLYGPALEAVAQLKKLHPDDKNLVFMMGWLHTQRGETAEAKELYGKAISLGFPKASIP
ncbi:MAG: hypothetical protein ACYCW6_30820 [Candidatus Xenobia bacterium]